MSENIPSIPNELLHLLKLYVTKSDKQEINIDKVQKDILDYSPEILRNVIQYLHEKANEYNYDEEKVAQIENYINNNINVLNSISFITPDGPDSSNVSLKQITPMDLNENNNNNNNNNNTIDDGLNDDYKYKHKEDNNNNKNDKLNDMENYIKIIMGSTLLMRLLERKRIKYLYYMFKILSDYNITQHQHNIPVMTPNTNTDLTLTGLSTSHINKYNGYSRFHPLTTKHSTNMNSRFNHNGVLQIVTDIDNKEKDKDMVPEKSLTARNYYLSPRSTKSTGIYYKSRRIFDINKRLNYSKTMNIKFGINCLIKVILPKIHAVFMKLNENSLKENISRNIQNKNKLNLLKTLLKKKHIHDIEHLLNAFYTWKKCILTQSLKNTKITNRVKGRILLSLSKNWSYLNKENAFYRWNVKANKKPFKKAIDRFALYSRINTHTSFWRLKSLIKKPELPKKDKRYVKMYKASIILTAVLNKAIYKVKSVVIGSLHCWNLKVALLKKTFQILNKNYTHVKKIALDRWVTALDMDYILYERNIITRCFLKAPDVKAEAFSRWKAYTAVLKGVDEKAARDKNLYTLTEFIRILKHLIDTRRIIAFESFKQNTKLVKQVEYMKNKLILCLYDKSKSFAKWKSYTDYNSIKRVYLITRIANGLSANSFRLIADAITKWKIITFKDNLRQEEARNTLGIILRSLYLKSLRAGYLALRTHSHIIFQAKLKVIHDLVNNTQIKLRNYFYKWKISIDKAQELEYFKNAMIAFSILENALSKQAKAILDKYDLQKLKRNFFMLFSKRLQARMSEVLVIWRKNCHDARLAEAISKEKKERGIEKMEIWIRKQVKIELKNAFEVVNLRARQIKLKKRVLAGLYRTKFGALFRAFSIWKRGKERFNLNQKKSTIKIYELLTNSTITYLKLAFDLLKATWESSNQIKLKALKRIFLATESYQKRGFRLWKEYCTFLGHVQVSKDVMNIFDMLNHQLRSCIQTVVSKDVKIMSIKASLFKILMNNHKAALSKAILTWRNNLKHMEGMKVLVKCKQALMELRLKENMVDKMTRMFLRAGFDALSRHGVSITKRRLALNRLCISMYGKLRKSFEDWVRIIKTVEEVERMMEAIRLMEIINQARRKMIGLSVFKSRKVMDIRGKFADRLKLILASIIKTNLQWAFTQLKFYQVSQKYDENLKNYEMENKNHKQMINENLEYIKNLELDKKNLINSQRLIQVLENILKKEVKLALEALKNLKNPYLSKKILCVSRIVYVTQEKLRSSFELWKNQSMQYLIKKFYDIVILEKSIINYVNSLRIKAFYRIRTTAILDYSKTYLNALWKWKLSNTEARYYMKQMVFVKRTRSVARFVMIIDYLIRKQKSKSLNIIMKQVMNCPKIRSIHMNNIMKIFKNKFSKNFHKYYVESIKKGRDLMVRENRALANACYLDLLDQKLKLTKKANIFLIFVRNSQRVYNFAKSILHVVMKYNTRQKHMVFIDIKSHIIMSHHVKQRCIKLGILHDILLKNIISSKVYAFNVLKYQSKLRMQVKTSVNKMLILVEKNHRHLVHVAFKQLHKCLKSSKIIKNFWKIINFLYFKHQKSCFDLIMVKSERVLMKNRLIGLQKLIRINHIFDQYTMYQYFHSWKKNIEYINPWFNKCLNFVAKNSRINFQIAFWRLRDSEYSNFILSAPKIIQCRKIINFVRKQYELSIAQAFWMIERYANADLPMLTPDQSGIHLLDNSQIFYYDKSSDLKTPMSARNLGQYDIIINKQRAIILKNSLNHISDKLQGIHSLRIAWEAIKIYTSTEKDLILNKLTKTFKENEIACIKRYGAIDLIIHIITTIMNRTKKKTFDDIYKYLYYSVKNHDGIEANNNINGSNEVDDDGEFKFTEELENNNNNNKEVHPKDQEAYVEYDKQSKELNEAMEMLDSLNHRLNSMISTKFIKNLDKYRLTNLDEAFAKIYHYVFPFSIRIPTR